jgi:NAD(P)-dependent dehydrogenase (short-subunit alcohol dehydrogenase family)
MLYTSSGAAFMAEKVRVTYAMSKVAIHALMRHVANRFGPNGIRANVIASGVIAHPRFDTVISSELAKQLKAQQSGASVDRQTLQRWARCRCRTKVVSSPARSSAWTTGNSMRQ